MAAWPSVVARLVAHLPTLPGWAGVEVFDGPPVTQAAPTDYVTVGFVVGEDFAGSYEQSRPGAFDVEEVGTVRCEVVCTTGDVDLAGRRARAFALVDAWEAWTTANPTLGVLNQSSSASLSVDVEPQQSGSGSTQRLTVTVSYLARY